MGVNLNFSPHSQRTEESEICLAEESSQKKRFDERFFDEIPVKKIFFFASHNLQSNLKQRSIHLQSTKNINIW
jgi:hypothetical protein